MKVNHDIHTHTLFSSCCYDPAATVRAFIDRAAGLGHEILGISNHLWDEKVPGASGWYKGQTIDYGFEAKYAIPADTKGVKVLFGTETEYCGMSDNLGMLAETAVRFDYVLIPHTHTHMKNFVIAENDDVKAYRQELIAAIEEKFPQLTHAQAAKMTAALNYNEIRALIGDKPGMIDEWKYLADFCFSSFESLMKNPEFLKMAASVPTLIAHPFWACGVSGVDVKNVFGHLLADKDRLYADFAVCAGLGVGLDVNIGTYLDSSNGFADDLMVAVMRIAKAAGCKFTFGTDTHSVAGLDSIRRGDAISEAIGIEKKDLHAIVC
ncbi:MAG: PHP domain-containing protein [Clostridia bacterium]|nr:PHP domain-containing protein [Clostridia bacterium]